MQQLKGPSGAITGETIKVQSWRPQGLNQGLNQGATTGYTDTEDSVTFRHIGLTNVDLGMATTLPSFVMKQQDSVSER